MRLGSRGREFGGVAELGREEGGAAGRLSKGFVVLAVGSAGGGAEESVRDVRDAKVGDLDRAVVLGPEEVGGFDVAVDDALVVDCKAASDLRLGASWRNARYSRPRTTSRKVRRASSTVIVGRLSSSCQTI